MKNGIFFSVVNDNGTLLEHGTVVEFVGYTADLGETSCEAWGPIMAQPADASETNRCTFANGWAFEVDHLKALSPLAQEVLDGVRS